MIKESHSTVWIWHKLWGFPHFLHGVLFHLSTHSHTLTLTLSHAHTLTHSHTHTLTHSHNHTITHSHTFKMLQHAEGMCGAQAIEPLNPVFGKGAFYFFVRLPSMVPPRSYLTEGVHNVVLQKSIPAQIRELILSHYRYK